jgi:hypothetical protein
VAGSGRRVRSAAEAYHPAVEQRLRITLPVGGEELGSDRAPHCLFADPHRTENEDEGTRKQKEDIDVNVGKCLIIIYTVLP